MADDVSPLRRLISRQPVVGGVPRAIGAFNGLTAPEALSAAASISAAQPAPPPPAPVAEAPPEPEVAAVTAAPSMSAPLPRVPVPAEDLEPNAPRRSLRVAIVPVVAIVAIVLLVSGLGIASLAHNDNSRANAALAATRATIDQAQRLAAAGDVDGAVSALEAAASSAPSDQRLILRGATADLLITAAGAATADGRPRDAVADGERAASYSDTSSGRTARSQLPGLLVDSARDLIHLHDTGDTAATWLRRVAQLAPGSSEGRAAATLLTTSTPVHGHLLVNGAPGAGVDVLLDPAPVKTTGSHPAPVRAQTDAAGAFDLGLVVPGTYQVSYVTPGAPARQPPGSAATAVVNPAQDDDLELSVPG